MSIIEHLPAEIWLEILSDVDPYALCFTSHFFNSVAEFIYEKCSSRILSLDKMRFYRIRNALIACNAAARRMSFYIYNAERGYMRILAWSERYFKVASRCLVSKVAAYNGHLHLIGWSGLYSISYAAMGGQTKVLELARNDGVMCTIDAMTCAARHGRMNVLMWCHSNCVGGKFSNMALLKIIDAAVRSGNRDLLRWLDNMVDAHNNVGVRTAIRIGSKELVDFYISLGRRLPNSAVKIAIPAGFEMMQWLKAKGVGIPRRLCIDIACSSGLCADEELSMLNWGCSRINTQLAITLCETASYTNKLHVIEWAVCKCEASNIITRRCLKRAAQYGNLEILKWLAERVTLNSGGYWYKMYNIAAKSGHIHILRWLYDDWSAHYPLTLCITAILGNRIEVLDWLLTTDIQHISGWLAGVDRTAVSSEMNAWITKNENVVNAWIVKNDLITNALNMED